MLIRDTLGDMSDRQSSGALSLTQFLGERILSQAERDANAANAHAAQGAYKRGDLPWFVWLPPAKRADGTTYASANYAAGAEPWFNTGGSAQFTLGAAKFFSDDPNWPAYLARMKLDPGADYMTALMQDNREGKTGKEYVVALYVRQGDYYKPLGFYEKYVSSGFVRFRDSTLIPLGMIALALAGGAIASQIGSAVVGPQMAAAYPGLTQAIGQTALSTALNGGDLESAVKGTALSFVGGNVGSLAKAATGIEAIGVATGAATTAALKGGDVSNAVASSLLSYGVKNVDFDSFFDASPDVASSFVPIDSFDPGPAFQPDPSASYFDPVYEPPAEIPAMDAQSYFDPVYDAPASWETMDWGPTAPLTDNTTDRKDWQIDYANVMDGGAFDPAGFKPTAVQQTPAQAAAASDRTWVTDLTQLALAAIQVNAAYQASQKPAPRTITTAPGGLTATPNANGTVTVRNSSTGQVSVQRPPVGQPNVLPDGSTTINNGNGTYTVIRPDGSTQTLPYTATGAGGALSFLSSVPPVAWAGLAALLFVPMLMRSRSR